MANTTDKNVKEAGIPKLPSMNFGKRQAGFIGGSRTTTPKSFILPPVRVTQNKGSGGK